MQKIALAERDEGRRCLIHFTNLIAFWNCAVSSSFEFMPLAFALANQVL